MQILSALQNFLLSDKLRYRCRRPSQFTDSERAIQEIPKIRQEKRKDKHSVN
jgi:hypothetical protein